MDEPVSVSGESLPAVAPRRVRALTWLFAAFALATVAFALWWLLLGAPQSAANEQAQTLRTQFDALNHDIAQLRSNTEMLRARLDDGEKVGKSVREQLLSLSERAKLVEDSVANLADKRLSGHDALALDEAELLLTLGGERYTLFHDAAAAVVAYRQADIALSEVEDPAFATVRQSVAAESAALSDTHAADAPALALQLARLRAQAAQWPAAEPALVAPVRESESRLLRALGAFVQVRHDDAAQTRAALHAPNLARELFLIDLHEAEAAALARDEARYRAELQSARVEFAAAFDMQAPAVSAASSELAGAANAVLTPPAPALLGAALKELRNLRATHALRESRSPALRPVGEAK